MLEPNSRRPLRPEKSRNRTSQSPSAHRSCTRTPGSAGIIRGSLSSQWRSKSRPEVGRRRLSCKRPSSTSAPQTVSNVPTKRAVKQGCGSPIFVKRTTPMFGSMYLKMPWVRKISPAARPISRRGFRNHLGRYSICDAYRASTGFTRGAKLQVTLLDSLEHGSRAIAHAKLRKNIGDVIFDGSFG